MIDCQCITIVAATNLTVIRSALKMIVGMETALRAFGKILQSTLT